MKAFTLIIFGLFLSLTQTMAQKGVEDGSKYGHGEDSIRCLKNLSLYSELVKQKRFDDAKPYWEIAFNECPLSTKNLYSDGEKILSYKINNASNKDEKNKYFQELMEVFDQRIEYFGDHPRYGTPYIKGRKALAMLRHKKNDSEIRQKAYELIQESIDESQEKTQLSVLASFMTSSVAMYKDDEIEAKDVVNNYTTISEIIDQKIEQEDSEKQKNKFKSLLEKIEGIFARSGAANCDVLEEIFTPQLEANKDDVEWLQRVSKLLARELCEDTKLLHKVSEYQHEIEPSSSSAYGLARMNLKSGNTERAIEYYKEAIDLVENESQKSEYYYQLGLLNLSQEDYVTARSNALKAAELRPEWGEPYILIGKAYAASAETIGDDEFSHKTAYWAAVDKFIKAKSIDSEVAAEADNLISTYRAHFPAKDEIFFQGYEIGKTYTVGGWIGEKTTVRAK